ncbi:MAG: nucleotidyltransferase family protein [Elusimicrobiota bacterium]
MKTLKEIERLLKGQKEVLKKKYGIEEIGVFGSYVRKTMKQRSDLDILVEFGRTIGLLKFVEIENYLGDLLGIKVDLVMKGALKPKIGRQILKEVIYL